MFTEQPGADPAVRRRAARRGNRHLTDTARSSLRQT